MLRAERAAGVSAGRQCAYLQVTRSQTRMSEKQAQGLPARVATGTGDSHSDGHAIIMHNDANQFTNLPCTANPIAHLSIA